MLNIGDKYNLLTIIGISDKKDSNYRKFYICKCDCGNTTQVRGDKLKSGHTKSCGCLNTTGRINNILNQKFNLLTVIEPTDQRRSGGDVVWKCQCECGKITYASASELRNNRIKSCGCLKSLGEANIKSLLDNNNILYKKEYTFKDLKDVDYLRFDFGILNSNNELQYLIEFDGEIHYQKSGWNGFADSEIIIKHDKIKNEYCKNNNIPLIRIPYWKRNSMNIEDLKLETSKYIFN